jgi:hypothetical protein
LAGHVQKNGSRWQDVERLSVVDFAIVNFCLEERPGSGDFCREVATRASEAFRYLSQGVLEDEMSDSSNEIQKAMEAYGKQLKAELAESEDTVRFMLRIEEPHQSCDKFSKFYSFMNLTKLTRSVWLAVV